MPTLRFPTDRIVGSVEWVRPWSDAQGPVLATGSVEVPEGTGVTLNAQALRGSEAMGGGSWSLLPSGEVLDLGFLRDLAPGAIESLSVGAADEESFDAIGHLAPGLRRLYLGWTGFSDAVLSTVAGLTGLIYLQTFGNNFTDDGVRQLAALANLEHLYLEERTLTPAAFDFVDRLPHLTRLGLQDVPLSQRDIDQLRERLPGIDIG